VFFVIDWLVLVLRYGQHNSLFHPLEKQKSPAATLKRKTGIENSISHGQSLLKSSCMSQTKALKSNTLRIQMKFFSTFHWYTFLNLIGVHLSVITDYILFCFYCYLLYDDCTYSKSSLQNRRYPLR
jgi:hypothetical protein